MGAGRSYINLSELVKDQNIDMQRFTYRCGHFEMASRATRSICLVWGGNQIRDSVDTKTDDPSFRTSGPVG